MNSYMLAFIEIHIAKLLTFNAKFKIYKKKSITIIYKYI